MINKLAEQGYIFNYKLNEIIFMKMILKLYCYYLVYQF